MENSKYYHHNTDIISDISKVNMGRVNRVTTQIYAATVWNMQTGSSACFPISQGLWGNGKSKDTALRRDPRFSSFPSLLCSHTWGAGVQDATVGNSLALGDGSGVSLGQERPGEEGAIDNPIWRFVSIANNLHPKSNMIHAWFPDNRTMQSYFTGPRKWEWFES